MNVMQTLVRRLVPGLCLVLLFCTLMTGLHRHPSMADHGTCVACAAGHSSALPADAAIVSVSLPAPREALPVSFRAAPLPATIRSASPRAPPLG